MTNGHDGITSGYRVVYMFSLETKDGMVVLTNGNTGRNKLVLPLLKEWVGYVRNK